MICRIYDVDGATLEQYDEVDQKFPELPDGGRCHIAGMLDGRLQVIEVWDSREQLEAFEEKLGPAMQEANVPNPKVTEFEVHNFEAA